MKDTFSRRFLGLFCDGHLGFDPSLFFVATDEADGSEVVVVLYVALFVLHGY